MKFKINPVDCYVKLNHIHGRDSWDPDRDILIPARVTGIAYYDHVKIYYDYEIMEGVAQPPLTFEAFSRSSHNHKPRKWSLLWMAFKYGLNELGQN